MSHDTTRTSRRRVLRYSGAALATLTTAGTASADHFHPAVTTDGVSNVGENGATLEGTLTDMGNSDSVDVKFWWDEASSSGLFNSTNDQTLFFPTSFAHDVSGLDPGTTYEFQAKAFANDTLVSGDVLSFTTDRMFD